MHQFLAYIKFIWHSTNEHGVHSPFIYNLLTECLYKKEENPAIKKILEYREALLNDEREIKVTDFGAGSRVFKSDKRKISAIARNAGISKKRAVLLNKLVSYLEIKNALELGTSVGISSAAIATGNDVKLRTIEGCPETAKVAEEYFERFGLENICLEVGSFEEVLSGEWKVESGEWAEGRGQWTEKGGERKEESGKSEHGETPSEKFQISSTKFQQTNTDGARDKTTTNKHQTINTNEASNPTPNPKPQTINNKPERSEQTPNTSEASPTPQHTTNNQQHTTFKHQTTNTKQQTQPTTDNRQLTTDLIYFDGNHQKEATLKYFEQLLPLAHNDSVFIFDDIHWSKGMEEAWEEIKRHPRVRVSVDTFFWGIVFFRKEQEKEHFIIRL